VIRLLIIVLALYTNTASARMTMFLADSNSGDQYFYEGSINRHGHFRRYWEIRSFRTRSSMGWRSSISHVDIDCVSHQRRVLEVVWKRGITGEEPVSLRQWRTDPWVGIVPGGLYEKITIEVCR
jgi:hypothetical protein